MTESGLVVTGRRARAAHEDPRDYPPNSNKPPVGSVGPNVAAGYGNTHVMWDRVGAPPVQAWQGWPVEWATPNWGDTIGRGEAVARVSVVFGAIEPERVDPGHDAPVPGRPRATGGPAALDA